jgi:hypothetical protein
MEWTIPDEYLLEELLAKQWEQRIADHMGRTVNSIRTKAHKMKRVKLGLPAYAKGRTRPEEQPSCGRPAKNRKIPRAILKTADEACLVDELIERGWTCYPPTRRKR